MLFSPERHFVYQESLRKPSGVRVAAAALQKLHDFGDPAAARTARSATLHALLQLYDGDVSALLGATQAEAGGANATS